MPDTPQLLGLFIVTGLAAQPHAGPRCAVHREPGSCGAVPRAGMVAALGIVGGLRPAPVLRCRCSAWVRWWRRRPPPSLLLKWVGAAYLDVHGRLDAARQRWWFFHRAGRGGEAPSEQQPALPLAQVYLPRASWTNVPSTPRWHCSSWPCVPQFIEPGTRRTRA